MLTRLLVLASMTLLGGCGGDTSGMPPLTDDRYEIKNAGACVLDTGTGLTWERKLDETGLRDWRNTYSWYDPDAANTEVDYRGTENGGSCGGGTCDIWHYAVDINDLALCGHTDWRVPTRDELYSISDLSKSSSPPTANNVAFPLMQAAEYWSGFDYSFEPASAWTWNFQFGHDRVDWKKEAKHVLLVRGSASELTSVQE